MAVDAVIYHNPKCSTSRKTLELLRDNGIEPDVVQYLKTPPSRAELVEHDLAPPGSTCAPPCASASRCTPS